jgi:hypothetical protein
MRSRIGVVLLSVSIGAAGCGIGGGASGHDAGSPSGYSVAGTELREDEFRYGMAPRPHKDVTYQPDVVMVSGGAAAVRSVTADGMTWTIDGKADGASKLVPGKVMFVTSRGVGRVVDARKAGADLAVTIAPVDITEVIKDGTFSGEQPIALDRVLSYSSEGSMWTDVSAPSAEAPQVDGVLAPVQFMAAGFRRDDGSQQPRVEQPRPVNGPPKSVKAAGFSITPVCCEGGVGAHLTYDDGEMKVFGTVTLIMEKPSARFHLAIAGGKVATAELQVSGGTGFKVDLSAGSAVGTDRQLNKTFAIPIDFSVPVGLVLGVPFTLTSNQWVIVKTAFSAKNGTIKATGEYGFGGTLGFGYHDGTFGPHVPQNIGFRNSLIDSIEGPSVGVNGIVLAYSTRFYLGIGAFGFSAGLYFGMTVSTGVTVGSSVGIIGCRGATLSVNVNFGVGYTMPQLAADVINFFLKVFHSKPVQRTGGIGSSAVVFNKSQNVPNGCN